MTTPCPTLVSSSYPLGSTTSAGYCFDGTYWYGTASGFHSITRYAYPAFTGATTIFTGTAISAFDRDAEYATLDFAGFLYCIDYTDLGQVTGPGLDAVIRKIDLSDLSYTELARFAYQPSHVNVWGLMFHPKTGLLYCASYEDYPGHPSGEIDRLWSIDPTSGAKTNLVTLNANNPGDHGLRGFEPMTTSPNYLWGRGFVKTASFDLWNYPLTGPATLKATDTPKSGGIGTHGDTNIVWLNAGGSGAAPRAAEFDTGLSSPDAPGCFTTPANTVTTGIANHDWTKVAWPLSTSVYEIDTPLPPPVSTMTNWSVTAPGWWAP